MKVDYSFLGARSDTESAAGMGGMGGQDREQWPSGCDADLTSAASVESAFEDPCLTIYEMKLCI